jgi:hypothetical protein
VHELFVPSCSFANQSTPAWLIDADDVDFFWPFVVTCLLPTPLDKFACEWDVFILGVTLALLAIASPLLYFMRSGEMDPVTMMCMASAATIVATGLLCHNVIDCYTGCAAKPASGMISAPNSATL